MFPPSGYSVTEMQWSNEWSNGTMERWVESKGPKKQQSMAISRQSTALGCPPWRPRKCCTVRYMHTRIHALDAVFCKLPYSVGTFRFLAVRSAHSSPLHGRVRHTPQPAEIPDQIAPWAPSPRLPFCGRENLFLGSHWPTRWRSNTTSQLLPVSDAPLQHWQAAEIIARHLEPRPGSSLLHPSRFSKQSHLKPRSSHVGTSSCRYRLSQQDSRESQ